MNVISVQTEKLDFVKLGGIDTAEVQDGASVNHTHSAVGRRVGLRRFVRHYLEMIVAMAVGMAILGMLVYGTLDALGWSSALDRPDLDAMVMATNMAVAMAGWMRYRGHAWAPTVEMCAAMYVPLVVLLVPLWLGAISEDALMCAGHMLMLPAMLVAMLRRRDEYTHATSATSRRGHMERAVLPERLPSA